MSLLRGLLLMLGVYVVRGAGEEAKSCVQYLDDVIHCFTAQGLDLDIQPGQQDATRIVRVTQALDPTVLCADKEASKAAYSCALRSLKKCLVVSKMEGAVPDIARLQQGLDVLCSRQQEFDSGCMKSKYQDILQCGQNTLPSVAQANTKEVTVNDMICISTDVNYDCAKSQLKSCGNDTMEIYLEQLDQYFVPEVCVKKSPGRPGRPTYSLQTGSNSSSLTLACLTAMASLATHLFLS